MTPLMAAMVQKNEFLFSIYEDLDRCWKLLGEVSIKARSIRGYKCRNYKMTANKFMLGEPKPEVLEDWDPRYVELGPLLLNEKGMRQGMGTTAYMCLIRRIKSYPGGSFKAVLPTYFRLVVTTLTYEDDVLSLTQDAEKDQKYCKSSRIDISATKDDVLTMVFQSECGVRGVRKFVRHVAKDKAGPPGGGGGGRKLSAPF